MRPSLGPDHPNVASAVNNLAELLRVTNRLDEAEPLYRRALAMDAASFGESHPKVAIRAGNLAGVLQATGRAREAVGLRQHSLAVMQASFSDQAHPYIKTAQENWEQLMGQLYVEGWLEDTGDGLRLRDEAEGPLPEDQRPKTGD